VPKSSKRKNDVRRANRDRRAKLEELKRQQRQAERRKNFLFGGSAIAVAIILIAAAVIPTYLHDRAKNAKLKVGYQASATTAEKAAGCTGVHNDPASPAAIHINGKAIDYAKQKYGDTRGGTAPIPPSGGPHNPVPLGATNRFYGLDQNPRPERAVHNLEHGFIVGWYDAKLPAADVAKLQTLAKDPSLTEFLVVGWTQGDLPAGKHFVLTSWGRTDRCASVSDTVVKAFYAAHLNDNKLAPEVGSGPGPATCPASVLDTMHTAACNGGVMSSSSSSSASSTATSTKQTTKKKSSRST
jgi:hypothetical protein